MFVRLRVLLLASLILVASGVWTGAQVYRRQLVDPPIVLSGSDIGFQVTSRDGNTPVGRLVVRMNGEWVPVKETTALSGLTTQ
jgi:hypothetical protein